MLPSLVGFRMEPFGDITDEVDDGLQDWMRHRDSMSSRDTYDNNFDCDKRDNDEFHASAGCLGEWGSPSCEVVHGRILTSWRSCRRTDCTSAAYVILSFTARVRALTSNAAFKEWKYPVERPSLALRQRGKISFTSLPEPVDPSRSPESRRNSPCSDSGPDGSAAARPAF